MIPAISQVCSLHSPFDKDIEDYAAGACRTIEIWLGKLETYLDGHSVAEVKELLARHEMQTPVASFQGGLLTSQSVARQEHWGHFERRLKLCQEIGVQTLVVAADFHGPIAQQDLDRARMSLIQAADLAAPFDVRLALEFQAQASFANNLQTAAALVAEADRTNLGLCFDVFHFYLGPSKFEDLAYLTSNNLIHVQLADLSGQPRELATDADRILPGDGDFQLQPILDRLRQIDYRGCVSLEILNPQIWQVPARQFGEIGMTALRKVLGQAGMGEGAKGEGEGAKGQRFKGAEGFG